MRCSVSTATSATTGLALVRTGGGAGVAGAEGSLAEATVDGALVLFEIPRELLQDRPLLLELRAGDRRGLMTLDV
jgi:hypothetical protein